MKFYPLLFGILFLLIFSNVARGQETSFTSLQTPDTIISSHSNGLPDSNRVGTGKIINSQTSSDRQIDYYQGSTKINNGFIPGINSITTQSVSLSKLVVSVDLSHVPVDDLGWYHNQTNLLNGNITSLGGTFNEITGVFSIPVNTNVLLIPNSNVSLTVSELTAIDNWYNEAGPRLLWVTGDSDFADLFSSDANNGILERIGSKLRLGTDTIQDSVNNDGASYRVAAQTPVADGEINSILTNNVSSIMMHGPTSVLGYENSVVVDLTTTSISNVEVIMKASSSATVVNNQTVSGEFDYYTANNIVGDYPMVAIENMGNQKYTLVSGETIFSDYKSMYDLFTETGTWNSGRHDGKNLVDNIFSWFTMYNIFPHAPISVLNDGDFSAQGFLGSGTQTDPFILEGINITSFSTRLINIADTTAYFEIRNSIFNRRHANDFALGLFNVQNGLLEGNLIMNVNEAGIWMENSNNSIVRNNIITNTNGIWMSGGFGSHTNLILNNTITMGSGGINLDQSTNNTITNNTITDNVQDAIGLIFSQNNTISGNELVNDTGGITFDQSTNNTIIHNTLSDISIFSIRLLFSHNNEISENIMSGNKINFGGISLSQSHDNKIIQNTIFESQRSIDNGQSGIGLFASIRNLIHGNYIYNWDFVAIHLQDLNTKDNVILQNQIFGNKHGLITQGTDNNITDNLIYNNDFGLLIDPSANGNFISENDFGLIGLIEDNGINNNFGNNYWSNWVGSGPYMIGGSANSQDGTPKEYPNHMSPLNLSILSSTSDGITSGLINFSWSQVDDSLNHSIEYAVYYSINDGTSWQLSAGALSTLTYAFDTSVIPDGSDTILRLIAEDEIGFQVIQISDLSYLIANSPHELSSLSFLTPTADETIVDTFTISWTAVTDSWGHGGIFYNILYFKGVATIESQWQLVANNVETTSYDWDTTTMENGVYSLSIEVFSNDIEDFVLFTGVITIANPVDTPTTSSTTSTTISASSTPATSSTEDSSVPFYTLNIAILSLITTVFLVKKQKSKFK